MIEELVPAGLRSKLIQSRLFAGTSVVARAIESHFKLSGTPFFREYTDHSFQHSVEVFKTACDVIGNEALEIISSDDLNVLILACMLHDSGLHITEDMFIELTNRENNTVAIGAFDSQSWPELWSEFVAEAKRFSAKKLVSLFGDNEPIREPPRRPIEMTARDRLLIGEFLRRHHPRFSHEFAIGVVPDAKGNRFEFKSLEPAVRDMTGLIARSHGIELRRTFDFIQHRYDLRDYNRVHLIFLMTLLRIADFLQIQSARAPELFGTLHNIKSPFSLGEWRLHQCIENITTSSLDPEAIFVAANPRSVHEFLKFEKWSKGLQSELDTSWAILGEVYGRFTREALNKLQLNIRRVRTNIEDRPLLQKRVSFVPDSIKFSVAEPELLKLLIAPLYGDDPLYGIRELTQNAADSVREMRHLVASGGKLSNDHLAKEADIELHVGMHPSPHVTITDRGAGMTLEVLKNFFLRAGASFRNSDLWKRQFEDAEGASKIARAGRFGVGALSAFLIGERIEVYTRHFSEPSGDGLIFSATIDEDEIEISKEKGAIGTRIKVISDQERIGKIARYFRATKTLPSFFESEDLTLTVTIDVAKVPKEENDRLTDAERQAAASALGLEPNWISIADTKYDRIRWDRTTHRWERESGHPEFQSGYLFCNDLLVGDLRNPPTGFVVSTTAIGDAWQIVPPTISITDNNGALPLDLARRRFARHDPVLADKVLHSMWSEFIASFFYSTKSRPSEISEGWMNGDFLFRSNWVPIIFGKAGFTFLDEMQLHRLAPKDLIVLRYDKQRLDHLLQDPFLDEGTFVISRRFFWSQSRSDILMTVSGSSYRSVLPDFHQQYGGSNRTFADAHFVFDKKTFEGTLQLRNAPKYLNMMVDTAYNFKVGTRDLVVVSRNDSDQVRKSRIGELAKRVLARSAGSASEDASQPMIVLSEYSHANPKPSYLSEVWEQSFNAGLIPYDLNARKQVLKPNAPITLFNY
jgi:hypothetical protein